ncbi:MAG: hypothetical protein QJR08_06430 [Bacillota bacterium]|nr:hypothetical protein [Bacillota bacterium]
MSRRLGGLATDLLLVALVALAFWLNAQLWRLPAAGEGPRPLYTAPGAVSNLRPGEVLRPVRLLVRGPDGLWRRLPDPQSQAAVTLWRATVQLAAGARVTELEHAPAGRPAAMLGQLQGPAVEILLPAPLPWASWLAVWRSEEAGAAPLASLPGGGPAVDRLLLFASGPGTEGEAPQLQLAAGDASGWRRVGLPGGEAAVAWLAALKAAQGEAMALEPVAAPAGLAVEADFLGTAAPAAASVAAPRLAEVRPDQEGLGHAVFGDMALVRRVELVDGEVLFTDGRATLRFPPEGGFVLERQASPGGPDRGLGRALLAAVDEVNHLGGWPAGSRLLAVEPLPRGGGWQLDFAAGFRGLPLVAPAEKAPSGPPPAEFQPVPPAAAIDVQVSPAGVVQRIAWHLEQVEGRSAAVRLAPLPAALAAAKAAGGLPAGAALADATLAWEAAGAAGASARPLWLLTLSDGRLLRLPAAGAEGG